MTLTKKNAEIYVPSGGEPLSALARATDLCIAAHQDDIEIMAYSPIARCYGSEARRFAGVVVSDGAGSPRNGLYMRCTDEQMKHIRVAEQKRAADIGDYSALALLGFSSAEIKSGEAAVADIRAILSLARPAVVYTHNPADKHDTHVAVCLRVIEALRLLPMDERPEKLYGMEVWRGLDWLADDDKSVFDTSARPNLAAALLGVYDSQISGGKRYDQAALCRRTANATFFESHRTDVSDSISFAIDMTPLIENDSLSAAEFISAYIGNFAEDVAERLKRLSG